MALAHRRLKFPTQKPSFKLSIHRSIRLHFRLHWSRLLVRSPIGGGGGGGSISAHPVLCSIARIRSPYRDSKMVLWVFGYGSLIWNPGFEFDEKIVGFIKDYRRVFDLACIDHRGTPENPARTCTLEPMEGAICWGSAYCVRGGMEKEIAAMKYLERRECEYDTKTYLDFYREGETSEPALTGVLAFVSTMDKESNKYYLGPAPLFEMARQIATANGPFGNNRDYLFLLEKAMSNIGHEDDYIIKLANEVRKAVDSLKQKSLAKVVNHSFFLTDRSEVTVADGFMNYNSTNLWKAIDEHEEKTRHRSSIL